MQTSDQGRAALKLEEGEVLKAYRDVVGIWTIGVGLTAKSGVVKPKAGMVITREQSDALLREALKHNYEPAVEMAMTITEGPIIRPDQYEFDAGVSFHFNTGAISKANWVSLWKANAPLQTVREALTAWSKAQGRFLPSLSQRREREFDMLMYGRYRGQQAEAVPHPVWPTWSVNLTGQERQAIMDGFKKLGWVGALDKTTVMTFQRQHDLTPDGIIGRATLSTLQRALDARAKATLPVLVAMTVPTAVASGVTDQMASIPHSGAAAVALAVLWLAQHVWAYRDIAAASLAPTFPRAVALLRSF